MAEVEQQPQQEAHEFASQNQLYAVLMLSCGAWRVRRPNRLLLDLVDDEDARPAAIAAKTSASADANGDLTANVLAAKEARTAEPAAAIRKGITSAADNAEDADVSPATADDGKPAASPPETPQTQTRAPALLLSKEARVEIGDTYLGNANLCVLLDIMAHLPNVEEVDWSGQKIFAADAFRQGPTGNDLLQRLFSWAGRQRNLHTIRLGANPVGTRAVHWMVGALNANPGLTTVDFDTSGVDAFLLERFNRALAANKSGARRNAPLPDYYRLSDELRAFDAVDRKTATDRRELHTLINEYQDAFVTPISATPSSSDDAAQTSGDTATSSTSGQEVAMGATPRDRFLSAVVSRSHRRTTAECVSATRGLRGDGGSLYIVDQGVLIAHIGGHDFSLRRGDYFGEVLESEMYVAGQIAVEARGTVFQLPHEVVEPLMKEWERRVQQHLPVLRQIAVLQPLPSWALIRACHNAAIIRHTKGETVITKGRGFGGLFIVLKGSYMVRGRAKLGRAQVNFTPGDVFGEEAAVSRLSVYTVEIKASSDEVDDCEALLISADHAKRHIVPHIRSVLSVHAKAYSDAV